MKFILEFDREEDGRWIAEISEIPGALAYGETKTQAESKVKALALRILADRMEAEPSLPGINTIAFTVQDEPVAVR